MRKHAVLEVYWETCSTGGLIGKHAVLEVLVRKHAVLEVLVRKHAVLEVILGNMQYWRSY